MEDYSKYIILSHLHWVENNILPDDVLKIYQEIKDLDIFSGVNIHQIQKKMGYEINYKEVITSEDYDKLDYLWLNLTRVKIDLFFIKFCSNLTEINIGCYDEVNLDILKENTKLKEIIANGNKISNIEALYCHDDLEVLNIQDNPCISLKPIVHLKKIKELKVGLIDDELDALNIIRNNSNCSISYIIKGGETDFDNFIFPYFYFLISKDNNRIDIHIEGVNDTSSYPTETRIPEELLQNKEYSDRLMNSLSMSIKKRLDLIMGNQISFDLNNSYSFGYSYHLNYIHQL